MNFSKGTLLAVLCIALPACVNSPSDEQVKKDFLTSKPDGESLKVTKVTRGDGWSDGAEVRVYFCEAQDRGERCKERYASMAYQKQPDNSWRLISIAP